MWFVSALPNCEATGYEAHGYLGILHRVRIG